MTTESNVEVVKPIRDIRWFWWQRRIRCWREKADRLRLLAEQHSDTETIKTMVDCLSTVDLIVDCANQLYNRNYKPGRFVSRDKRLLKKSLRVYANYTKSALSYHARGYRTLYSPFHNVLRSWRHYWFRRNLRNLVWLISGMKLMISGREFNRKYGIGSARKYTYDTDPFIKHCHSFINDVVVLVRWNYELYMDRDPFYKSFLGRRAQAGRIRNGITSLCWRFYYFPDPNK